MISSAITNCTVPVIRGSVHRADPDALLDPRERVGQERDDRRAGDRAADRRPPADHQHREERERDREVELVRVERDHALRPERARGPHHRGAQEPRRVARTDDVRPERRGGQRVLPRRAQPQAGARLLVEAPEEHEHDRRHRRRSPSLVRTGIPARPSDPRVNVVAFWRNVWTTTSSASVAIAIVDSVMRMMPPPKIAATTSGDQRRHDDRRRPARSSVRSKQRTGARAAATRAGW